MLRSYPYLPYLNGALTDREESRELVAAVVDLTYDKTRNIITLRIAEPWPTEESYLSAYAEATSCGFQGESAGVLLDFRAMNTNPFCTREEMLFCSRVLGPHLPSRRACLTSGTEQLEAARLLQAVASRNVTVEIFTDESAALAWLGAEATDSDALFDRRRHSRIRGPFDGRRIDALETPLQIFDLSLGGCFVNSLHEQQEGVVFKLQVELPGEGWIPLKAHVLYRRAGGYAVRFLDVDQVTRQRLERGLRALSGASR